MYVIGEQITLPSEDPLAYQVDWRHRIATAVCRESGHRLPRSLPRDEYLLEYTSFLRQEPAKREPDSVYAQAVSWYANGVRHAIESLLITAGTYDEITQVLNVSKPALLAYMKIFFDVRDDTGAAPNAVLNVRFNHAPPDDTRALILRNAALAGGFSLLKSMLSTNSSTPIDLTDSAALRTLVNEEFARRLLSGRMSPADLSRVIAAQAQLEKLKLDSGQSDKELRDVKALLKSVIELTAPKRLESDTATSLDDVKKYHDRVVAFQNVTKEGLADSGIESAVKQWGQVAATNIAQTMPG